MFKAKTVIILGAGASWHYGYPTGEELVKLVINKARTAREYFTAYLSNSSAPLTNRPRIVSGDDPAIPKDDHSGLQKQWTTATNKCQELNERLNAVDPLVIDYFIEQNRDLEEITKLCIAWVILEREFVSIHYGGNENRRGIHTSPISYGNDNWYRYLVHKLTSGCTNGEALLSNNVTFVTFNYDVSLEITLYSGLGHLAKFSPYTEKFITENDSILHVYGRLRKDPPWHLPGINWETFGSVSLARSAVAQTSPPQFWADVKAILDHSYEASQGLQLIAPEKMLAESDSVPDHIQKARNAIAEAQCVYILGYGFDQLNSGLLNLSEYFQARTGKQIMFTNFNNSGVVNKNAARLFAMHPNELLVQGGRLIPHGPSVIEKSVKDVYGALALDFDSPEEQLRDPRDRLRGG
jgi:hypothetical protein